MTGHEQQRTVVPESQETSEVIPTALSLQATEQGGGAPCRAPRTPGVEGVKLEVQGNQGN